MTESPQLSFAGASVPLVLPPTSDPPPLQAMVPVVESVAGAVSSHAQYKASAKLSGVQASAAATAYAQTVNAMAQAVTALLAPAIAAGDETAAQIVAVAQLAYGKAQLHEVLVQETAATLG